MTATAAPPGIEPTMPWPRTTDESQIDAQLTEPPPQLSHRRRWAALLYAWIFQRTAAARYVQRLEHLEGLALEYRRALDLADQVGIYARLAEDRLRTAIRRQAGGAIEPRAEMSEATRWHRREDLAQRRIMRAISDIVIACERGAR